MLCQVVLIFLRLLISVILRKTSVMAKPKATPKPVTPRTSKATTKTKSASSKPKASFSSKVTDRSGSAVRTKPKSVAKPKTAAKTKTTSKTSKSFEQTLWDTADKLRGSVESSEYKHDVLSLILEKYHQHCDPLFVKMTSLKDEGHSLTKLRDILLPKLLSGELRIPEADKLLEQV